MNQQQIQIRWADLDPNFHVRHSAYYDYAAHYRVQLLQEKGVSPQVMLQHNFGPILFREECQFRKEIRPNDIIYINAKLQKMRTDGSRWTIVHNLFTQLDKPMAIITVDGAWIDTIKRKLIDPVPTIITDVMNAFDKADDFEWV